MNRTRIVQHQDLLDIVSFLCEYRGYRFEHVKGQRIYTHPAAIKVPRPQRGSEIYIGKLGKNVMEDQLVPLFERLGRLYEFRMMTDSQFRSRGFAFATYFEMHNADRAIRKLDSLELEDGVKIVVEKSVDNRTLYLNGLDPNVTEEDVKNLLNIYLEGIQRVSVLPSRRDYNLNRGYGFVEFSSHRQATIARHSLVWNNLTLLDQGLQVDWAETSPPRCGVDQPTNMRTLYMRNIPLEFSDRDLKRAIKKRLQHVHVQNVYKNINQNHAYVYFVKRKAARKAFNQLQGFRIEGNKVQVEWALPKMQKVKLPDHTDELALLNRRRNIDQVNAKPFTVPPYPRRSLNLDCRKLEQSTGANAPRKITKFVQDTAINC
ncbi:RNA-binding protein 47-like [Aethina tumida]|uniref:RNA-binding protein 47-like n=1 Tax=Aethina tumida TaxID=116153 RepID=UPI002147738F|nr:RNA-binding protein 47-like [Aethina tumida]